MKNSEFNNSKRNGSIEIFYFWTFAIFIILSMFCSCTAEDEILPIKSEKPKPEYSQVNFNIVAKNDVKIVLIDYNGTIPDTLVKTSNHNFNIYLLKRGWFELKITNPTYSENSILIKSENKEIFNHYFASQSGCTIQFFNK